jgi:hypothetical protein
MNAPTAANACQSAADLLAEAGRRMHLPPRTRLECLAAEQALQTHGRAPDARAAALGSEDLISLARRKVGEPPHEQFRDPSILKAARHARQALRGQSPWRPR